MTKPSLYRAFLPKLIVLTVGFAVVLLLLKTLLVSIDETSNRRLDDQVTWFLANDCKLRETGSRYGDVYLCADEVLHSGIDKRVISDPRVAEALKNKVKGIPACNPAALTLAKGR